VNSEAGKGAMTVSSYTKMNELAANFDVFLFENQTSEGHEKKKKKKSG